MSTGLVALVSAVLAGGAVAAAGAARRTALARLTALGMGAPDGGGSGAGRWAGSLPLRRARPTQVDLPLLCGELAAVMRAGLPPAAAWQALAERRGPQARVCRQVLAAARTTTGPAAGSPFGASTGTGLAAAVQVVAGEAGAARGMDRSAPLRWLALGLAVSDRSGAPTADVLGRLAVALRAEAAAEADRAAVMAGPRATAAVLSVLPVGGVGLGMLIGADPVRALATAPAGRVCLVAGLLLWGAGVGWALALLRRAERAGTRP